MKLRIPLVLLMLLLLAGCAQPREESPDDALADPPAELPPPLQNISLRRIGGVAGLDDRLMINAAGEAATSGRTFGARRGRLSDEQIQQLVTLFTGFERLDPAYPPPDGLQDDLQYQLTWGTHVVRASSANAQLPAQLRGIIQYLERLAVTLPPR